MSERFQAVLGTHGLWRVVDRTGERMAPAFDGTISTAHRFANVLNLRDYTPASWLHRMKEGS